MQKPIAAEIVSIFSRDANLNDTEGISETPNAASKFEFKISFNGNWIKMLLDLYDYGLDPDKIVFFA